MWFLVLVAMHVSSFNFKDGDKLMLKDEGRNAVIHIASIQYFCGGREVCVGDNRLDAKLVDMQAKAQRAFEPDFVFI